MFSVCMCSRFQMSHMENQFMTVDCILRYLIKTLNHGIWFPKSRDAAWKDSPILLRMV